MGELSQQLRTWANNDHAKATLLIRWRQPTGEIDWTPVESSATLADMLHGAAYAIETLEERCGYYVEDLEIAKEHFHTIRDWLGEKKLEAVDNMAGEAAASIARRLPEIAKHGAEAKV